MNDWKKKVENHLEQERLVEENAEDERQREEQQKKAEAAEKLHTKRMAHLATFKCHICKKASAKPKEYHISGQGDDPWDHGTDVIKWDVPGDLWKCSECGQWACKDHIHRGICMKCAKKL